jgi:hypothetical protein
MELFALTVLGKCMSAQEAAEIGDIKSGMHPRVLHEELLRLPAVVRRVGLRKTAATFGGQNVQSWSRSV